MAYHLTCVVPTHGYARGQKVTDPDEVVRLLSDHRVSHFVKTLAPDEPPPPAAIAPAPDAVEKKPASFA